MFNITLVLCWKYAL